MARRVLHLSNAKLGFPNRFVHALFMIDQSRRHEAPVTQPIQVLKDHIGLKIGVLLDHVCHQAFSTSTDRTSQVHGGCGVSTAWQQEVSQWFQLRIHGGQHHELVISH